MVRSKPPKSKKPKHGVDFKKIKHKIGRKLPPPKNTTNTQIKSIAIVLPEQSIVTDRAGFALNKKGLTLRELLQQTSHHNSKIRKAAISGIRDLVTKYPSELKQHKLSIIEKLRERIRDTDKVVRETLYQLFKTVIFPTSKEDITAPVISLMMDNIFNAMTHISVDIRSMAFQFFELVVSNFPSSFTLHSEKVLDNYILILSSHQIYLADKGKLKNALGGLLRCLSLLINKNRESNELNTSSQNAVQRRGLFTYQQEVQEANAANGLPPIENKLNDLVPELISSFLDLTSLLHATAAIDPQSFDCMLCTLQCIDTVLKICDVSSLHGKFEILPSSVVLQSNSMRNNVNGYLRRLWEVFPVCRMHNSLEKEDAKYLILDTSIAEIFLHLSGWEIGCYYLDGKFLEFIESLLLLKAGRSKIPAERHVLSVLPFIPRLLSQVDDSWKFRILEAFTSSFKDSKLDAKLISPYISAVEELLFDERCSPSLQTSMYCSMVDYQVFWLREIPELLFHLGDKHPSLSMVILKLLLRIGKTYLPNSSLGLEYDNLQHTLMDFFCAKGSMFGPFLKLPVDCKELAICCIYYYSSLKYDFLEALITCCLSNTMESSMLLRVVEVLHSAYKAGRIIITDHISFLVTLVARFEVYPERFLEENHEDSNRKFFRSLTGAVISCLSQLGDNSIVLKLLSKCILDAMSLKPSLDNIHGLLRIIIALDKRPSMLAEEDMNNLSNWLVGYMIKAASHVPESLDASIQVDQIEIFQSYMKPSNILFSGSAKLLKNVLEMLDSLINRDTVLPNSYYGECNDMEIPKRVHIVASIIIFMHEDQRLHDMLSSNKSSINGILLSMQRLLDSSKPERTYEERHRISTALDHLKRAVCISKWWNDSDLVDA